MMRAWVRLLCAAAVVAAASPAQAQVGSSTDILVGRVSGPDGRVLQGARVEATSIETGVTRSRNTDAQGRYTILFPDGGGQYRITVRMLGLSPSTAQVNRQADEDRLVHDFVMSTVAATLDAIVVNARPAPRAGERPEPGQIERVLTGEQLARLPIDATDPNILALLQPGVIGVAGTDTSAAAFSVAGQRTDQNQVTLDGLTFGSSAVPQEAVRSTRVITNTYDVARGQFTGGQVSSTTRGGTNRNSGSLSYSLRDPRLEFDGEPAESQSLNSGYSQHQFSGGLGGPIVADKLFWFGSFQVRRRIDPLQSLTILEPATLQRLGTSPDSAARFRTVVDSVGIPLTLPSVPDDRLSDNGSFVGRLDWTINDDHTLMVRGNWQGSLQNAFRSTALSLPSHAGEQRTDGYGGMVTLSSVLGSFLNEGRFFYSDDGRNTSPYLSTPEGRVRIASQLTDGSLGINTLDFGGNTGMPTQGENTQLEFTNELSWLSGGGSHRFKLGALYNHTGFSTANQNNQFGSFTYNSLADLEANTPAEFRRSLNATERNGGSSTGAIYLGDTWRKSRAVQITMGVRVEGSAYDGRPAYNPAVDSIFGHRTDFFPTDVRVSPRVGFTWQIGLDTAPTRRPGQPGAQGGQGAQGRAGAGGGGGGGGGGAGGRGGAGGGPGGGGGFGAGGASPGGGVPFLILRGGVGEFRGRAPTNLFQSAIDATGLPGGQETLICVGSGVPTPNWSVYMSEPDSIPSACVGAPGPTASGQRVNVTVFDREFSTPRSIRASLGATRRLSPRYGLTMDYTYALGTSLYGMRDMNLDTSANFTLANEASRPVFSPATAIVPATGAVSVFASRNVATYGQVVQAISELESHTHQITTALNGVNSRNMVWNLAYTRMWTRDQTGFAAGGLGGGGGASTVGAGNPNALTWGTGDLQRKHQVQGTLTWMAKPWLDLTGVLRVTSGQPYTPRVSGDVNGDGSRNDRAFIFDPSNAAIAGDTALVNGMQRVLATTPDRARECLQAQLGTIATRNSCVGAWQPTLDLQANLRPTLGRLNRRLTLSIVAINPLAGLDQLLHDDTKLRGWGQPNRPDATLLYVRGFDPGTNRYIYQVNERFGDNAAARSAFRTPFMLGLTARMQLGPDRQREQQQAALNALNRRGGAEGFDFKAIVDRIAPNPTRQLIDRKDSLKLTPLQIVKLQLIGDSLNTKNAMLVDSLTALQKHITDSIAAAQKAAPTPAPAQPATPQAQQGPQQVFRNLQPMLQKGRDNYLAAIESIKGVLTEEQWNKLPENFRNPVLRGPGLGRPGAGRPPQRPPV